MRVSVILSPVDDEDEDDKPDLKVVKKTRTGEARAPRVKPVLKGFIYAYRIPVDDAIATIEVEKAQAGVNEATGEPYLRDATYMVTNDTCDCPAGENAILCKHLEMVQGRYRGNRFKREDAENITEEFLDTFRKVGASVAVIGTLAYTDREWVTRADVLVFQENGCSDEIVMYAEYKNLLIRTRYLPSKGEFDKTLSGARIAWMNKKRLI